MIADIDREFVIRRSNQERVADYISDYPGATMPQISIALKMSLASVSLIVRQLKKDGRIVKDEPCTSKT